MTSQLYTLEDLLKIGIQDEQEDGTIVTRQIAHILIPKIQRSYAQGRKEEYQVRDSLLSEIFEALTTRKEMDFSFIYGALTPNKEHKYEFELLDGQQRLTTLFLLHAYIYIREQGMVPEWMVQHFSYETRSTSTEFIDRLCELTEISKTEPSELIGRKLWYNNALKLDSTVLAMLNMLDAIHDRYEHLACNDLASQLGQLKFYVLPLDKFGLTEELYIKMNARGLPLTPFECFKADLVGYGKPDEKTASDEQLTEWLDFATKLDTKWLDLFWDKDNGDVRYFRFFYRYSLILFYTQYDTASIKKGFRARDNALYYFFANTSEDQAKRYAGFQEYKTLLDAGIDIISYSSRILDTYHEHRSIIEASLTSAWDERYEALGDKYTDRNEIIFAAICMYITSHKDFDEINYRRWMRMAWNITANTNIDGIAPKVALVKHLKAILDLDKANDIYIAIQAYNSDNQAIQEEVRKTKYIKSNIRFEDLFAAAEGHKFLRGYLDVVLSDDDDSYELIERRLERIQPVFNENGVDFSYLPNHLFLRGIMASFQKWESVYITEKTDADAHIKSLLRRPNVSAMMREILDSQKDIKIALEEYIDSRLSADYDCWYIDEAQMLRARRSLLTDVKLWDWIYDHTSFAKAVILKHNQENCVKVRVPGNWYDKIYIGCRRKEFVKDILSLGYEYVNESQKEFFAKYNDYYDDSVGLWKQVADYKLFIYYKYNDTVSFWVQDPSEKQQELLYTAWPNVQVDSTNFFCLEKGIALEDAFEAAERIERCLQAAVNIHD